MALPTLPDAVQWSEGMLLSPQHMQQNDIYWHEHLRHRLSSITPYHWGVMHLTLDPSALVKGVISVTALECVLPEGLAVSFPGNYRDLTLDIEVDALVKTDGRPVRVWVQVKERSTAAARADNTDRRYDSIPGEMTPDENTGDGSIQVARLQTHIALYAGDASKPAPAGRGACPLLDLVRDAHGHLRIATYHPPLLHVAAASFLHENSLQRQMNGLLQRIWTKLEELADSGEDNASHEDDNPMPGPHLHAARLLAKALPQLEIAANAAYTHPEALYRALAHMVGQVSSIGANPLPLKMKPYRHDDCLPQFQTAFDYIDAKLALLNTAYESLQFVQIDIPGVGPVRFARSLSADMTGEVIVELKPKEGQTGERFVEWLNSASIVSDTLIHTVEKGRLRGAVVYALSAQEIRERGLRPQAHLFRLESRRIPVDGKGMQASFHAGQVLLIHGPETPFMPAAIVLHRHKTPRNKTANAEAAAHA